MKNRNIHPTSIEKVMRPDDFVVSKTDTQGRITYGNDTFFEFSGYSESELLGVQHNVIRHPDMPRSAFNLVWKTIESGQECHAYVKNMAKDGSFYWVFANITPDFDTNGKIVGYFSVRRAPRRSAIAVIESVYAAMLRAENAVGSRYAIEAGTNVLLNVLNEKGLSYEQLILAI